MYQFNLLWFTVDLKVKSIEAVPDYTIFDLCFLVNQESQRKH